MDIEDHQNGALEFNESGDKTAHLYSENELEESHKQEFNIEEDDEFEATKDEMAMVIKVTSNAKGEATITPTKSTSEFNIKEEKLTETSTNIEHWIFYVKTQIV